jgi:hypothetical protein
MLDDFLTLDYGKVAKKLRDLFQAKSNQEIKMAWLLVSAVA